MRLTRFALASALIALTCAALAQTPAAPMQQASAAMAKKVIAPSTGLTLVISGKSTTLTLAQIAALPHKTVTVYNLHEQKNEAYSGVSLADILTANGAPFEKTTQHDMLRSYVLAQGMDGYGVIYSTVEVYTPDYHTGDVIVADTLDGKLLDKDGLKLISTEDKHPMRWVHSLTKITLVQTSN
jgi:hypothetical protein